jgi:hypothetical protein
MNTNPKSKSSHPEFSRQLRDMTETGAQQSNEVLEERAEPGAVGS